MSCPLGADEINKLRAFITLCSLKPELLNIPELAFFKEFVERLGGKVPPEETKMPSFQKNTETKPTAAESPSPEEPEEESEPESDIELDMTGVIQGDTEEPQFMGDNSKVPTEDEIEEASSYRIKAAQAYSEQNYNEAIQLYTKAIELNPGNALFHAKRGQTYIKLQKPNACIRDCDRALELNCDSAAAYKYRGRAHRLLGHWEQAAKDLRQACKLDFDEETDEWLKEVTPNAKKIEQHKIKQDRKKQEKEIRKQQERIRKAQDANKKAQEQQQKSSGLGGSADGGSADDMFRNINPSDFIGAFNDPEIAAAMQDIIADPLNIAKYQSNPKIMKFFEKVTSAMGGHGFPGSPQRGGAGAATGAGAGAGATAGAGADINAGMGTGDRMDANSDSKSKSHSVFSDDGLD